MKTFSAILILSIISLSFGQAPADLTSDAQVFLQFQNFTKTFNKTYGNNDEWLYRLQIFKNNYKQLQGLNNSTNSTIELGITSFSDLTPQEFNKKYLNLDITLKDLIEAQSPSNSLKSTLDEELALRSGQNCSRTQDLLSTIPKSIDWRTRGAVGPVRNQGSCGGCWAFSTVSNIQSRHFLKYGVLLNLSEQMLVDCNILSNGCGGGIMKSAFDYLMQYTNGAVSNPEYPYIGYQSTCRRNNLNALTQVSGYAFAGTTNEDSIAQMLATFGPLAVAMNANYLQYYRGGIINLSASVCNPFGLNHAVNLVGYGEENGIKFWIVRNSWGPNWGENGYFRIARGSGVCGINQYVITSNIR